MGEQDPTSKAESQPSKVSRVRLWLGGAALALGFGVAGYAVSQPSTQEQLAATGEEQSANQDDFLAENSDLLSDIATETSDPSPEPSLEPTSSPTTPTPEAPSSEPSETNTPPGQPKLFEQFRDVRLIDKPSHETGQEVIIAAAGVKAPVYTAVFKSLVPKGQENDPQYNYCGNQIGNPCGFDRFENKATTGNENDSTQELVAILNNLFKTGEKQTPDEESLVIHLGGHRSSNHGDAVGNGIANNHDVDPATTDGPGVQVGDIVRLRMKAEGGQYIDVKWRVVGHPVMDVGEPLDTADGWVVSKELEKGRSGSGQQQDDYNKELARRVANGELDDKDAIIANTAITFGTSHKGTASEPQNVDGYSNNIVRLVAIPIGVEFVDAEQELDTQAMNSQLFKAPDVDLDDVENLVARELSSDLVKVA